MATKHMRVLSGIAGAMVTVTVVSGCGGGETADVNGEVAGEIGFSYWGSPSRAEKVTEIIEIFQAQYPEASVSPEVAEYAAYIERLTVRAAGQDLACATGTQDTFFTQYADSGVLMPLDDFMGAGTIGTADINPQALETGQFDGQQYMIPTGTFVRVLGYNAAQLQPLGVPAPTPKMTWEQYGSWLRSVQAVLPPSLYAGENEGGLMFVLQAWVLGHGQQMYREDGGLGFSKELLTEHFNFWLDLAQEGAVVPPDAIAEQYLALEQRPLATGKALSASRDIPQLTLSEDVLLDAGKPADIVGVSAPREDPGVSSNVLGANGISIPSSCENSATAAAFIDTFTNNVDAAVAFQSDNGIVTSAPAQDALLADPETSEGVKGNIALYRELAETDDLAPVSSPPGANSLTPELRRLYEAAAFGSMTVPAAVDAFFAAADNALN